MLKLYKLPLFPENTALVPDSAITLDDDNKIDVLLSLMNGAKATISEWTERSYKANIWSVGIILSIVSFWLLYGQPGTFKSRIIISIGILLFGGFTQLYFVAALRAYQGNGDILIKCEAALGLCEKGSFFKEYNFFGYAGKWLPSQSLKVLRIFHLAVLLFSIVTVLSVSPIEKKIPNLSIKEAPASKIEQKK